MIPLEITETVGDHLFPPLGIDARSNDFTRAKRFTVGYPHDEADLVVLAIVLGLDPFGAKDIPLEILWGMVVPDLPGHDAISQYLTVAKIQINGDPALFMEAFEVRVRMGRILWVSARLGLRPTISHPKGE
jgi:hypothetical protein